MAAEPRKPRKCNLAKVKRIRYFTESSRANSEWVEVSEARRPWSIFSIVVRADVHPKYNKGQLVQDLKLIDRVYQLDELRGRFDEN